MLTVSEYQEAIKLEIMELLYLAPLKYWNRKLIQLSEKNRLAHNRRRIEGQIFGTHYAGRNWLPQELVWTACPPHVYCLGLHPDLPELSQEMAIIAEEMGELQEEKYEVDRFLVNLFLFSAPPKILQKILGDTIYSAARSRIELFCAGLSDKDWNMNNELSMKEYVEQHKDIVQKMNARVLLNLITADSLKDR